MNKYKLADDKFIETMNYEDGWMCVYLHALVIWT
jgi:hypothetical protein